MLRLSAKQHQTPATRLSSVHWIHWIDSYEVTNTAYQQFVNAGGYTTQSYWLDAGWSWKQSNKITGPRAYPNLTDPSQPRVGVSRYEAAAYAKWRGGRLPTEAEWEYAARGRDLLIYPWGNTWGAKKANTYEEGYGSAKSIGSYEGGKSWVGAYDLAGNALEWVADWYDAGYYQQAVRNDPQGPACGDSRVIRGGSWVAKK